MNFIIIVVDNYIFIRIASKGIIIIILYVDNILIKIKL